MALPNDIVELFLTGAEVVAEAVASPEVAAAWDQPSVLEEQTVGSLAGHLARGGVWVVADYLDAATPEGPVDLPSAAAYFAKFTDVQDPTIHQAIRDRGASVAAVGRDALVTDLRAAPRRAGASVAWAAGRPAGAGVRRPGAPTRRLSGDAPRRADRAPRRPGAQRGARAVAAAGRGDRAGVRGGARGGAAPIGRDRRAAGALPAAASRTPRCRCSDGPGSLGSPPTSPGPWVGSRRPQRTGHG